MTDLGDDHSMAKADSGKRPPLVAGLLLRDFENRLRSRTGVQTLFSF